MDFSVKFEKEIYLSLNTKLNTAGFNLKPYTGSLSSFCKTCHSCPAHNLSQDTCTLCYWYNAFPLSCKRHQFVSIYRNIQPNSGFSAIVCFDLQCFFFFRTISGNITATFWFHSLPVSMVNRKMSIRDALLYSCGLKSTPPHLSSSWTPSPLYLLTEIYQMFMTN